jgi:hypothetical protein
LRQPWLAGRIILVPEISREIGQAGTTREVAAAEPPSLGSTSRPKRVKAKSLSFTYFYAL